VSGAAGRIRLLVVDDHPVVLEGLRALFARLPDCEVVGEANSGEAALADYRRLAPDVVVLDLRLPGMDGAAAIAELLELDPQARVVVLTSFGGDADIRRALAAGARGVVLKGAPADELIEAVQRVRAGETFLGRDAQAELTQGQDLPPLTSRELEVLELVASGLRNREVADALGLSISTVKVHVNRILDKLDAQDRTEAVTRALRRGLIAL
jgi:two-component system NarL family response regulator